MLNHEITVYFDWTVYRDFYLDLLFILENKQIKT